MNIAHSARSRPSASVRNVSLPHACGQSSPDSVRMIHWPLLRSSITRYMLGHAYKSTRPSAWRTPRDWLQPEFVVACDYAKPWNAVSAPDGLLRDLVCPALHCPVTHAPGSRDPLLGLTDQSRHLFYPLLTQAGQAVLKGRFTLWIKPVFESSNSRHGSMLTQTGRFFKDRYQSPPRSLP